ncbi:MAG TPA: fumarylacetoacetate hydrolase family protein, partial [Burkholderiaceae bacterium]|nr:fumarylacetoacetate hydrolase family protein [Burkholderiaceae bacterium]
LAGLELLAPVPRPGQIVAVGRNYGEHAKEAGGAAQEQPRIISKLPSSVIAPGGTVPAGPVGKLDFEVELAVVIGAFARDVPRERALDVVAGYTVLDDVSAREFQFDVSPPQTTFAKSLDGYCPMGPWLVTRDEVPDPQALELSCWLNGERMQHASTAGMIFPVDVLIAYVSRFMTLEPGDVLATGTPSGVGAFRTPPVWLKAGDRLRLEVERVGVLEHGIG